MRSPVIPTPFWSDHITRNIFSPHTVTAHTGSFQFIAASGRSDQRRDFTIQVLNENEIIAPPPLSLSIKIKSDFPSPCLYELYVILFAVHTWIHHWHPDSIITIWCPIVTSHVTVKTPNGHHNWYISECHLSGWKPSGSAWNRWKAFLNVVMRWRWDLTLT